MKGERPVASYTIKEFLMMVAVISGIVLGTFAALRHNGIIDYLAMTCAVIGLSVPNFVLATGPIAGILRYPVGYTDYKRADKN